MKIFLILLSALFVASNMKPIDLFPGEKWHSGFVKASDDSKFLHYVLFECRNKSIEEPPLLVWFSGGPGYSSMYGLYAEGGAYIVNNQTKKLERNKNAWNNIADVIFVNQPAGTSFSIANDYSKMCTTIECVGKDFLAFLLNFYDKFPQYKLRDLYISGVSYGGHYVPSISAYLLRQGKTTIPLKGFLTFNGYYEYYTQAHGNLEFLREKGLISDVLFYLSSGLIEICRLTEFYKLPFFPYLCSQSDMLIFLASGIKEDPYDVQKIYGDDLQEIFMKEYLNRDDVQEAYGVNQLFVPFNGTVFTKLLYDALDSSLPEMGMALDKNLKVGIVHGDSDFVCSWNGGKKIAHDIPWFGKEEFSKKAYEPLEYEGVKKGEMKKHKNLRLIRIYNAGHHVFLRQPETGLQILYDLLYSD